MRCDDTGVAGFLGRADWRLGLGTYRLGVGTERIARAALRIGYRHIDTAALYRNELAVASAIASSGVPRKDICLSTKIHVRDIDRLTIRQATEAALARLGQVDVLMLHAWRPNAPEAWALLAEEVKAGRVRAIGVSNFGAADLAALGPPIPIVNQIELSPFLPRRSLRQACHATGVAVAAHSPLTKTQKFADLQGFADLPDIAGEFTPAQLLLAWGLENATVVLPGSSDEEHLRENLAALEIALSASQRSVLNSISDGFATHPNALR